MCPEGQAVQEGGGFSPFRQGYETCLSSLPLLWLPSWPLMLLPFSLPINLASSKVPVYLFCIDSWLALPSHGVISRLQQGAALSFSLPFPRHTLSSSGDSLSFRHRGWPFRPRFCLSSALEIHLDLGLVALTAAYKTNSKINNSLLLFLRISSPECGHRECFGYRAC